MPSFTLRNLFATPRRCLMGCLAAAVLLLLVLAISGGARAERAVEGPAPHTGAAPVDVEALIAKHGLSGVRVGYHVIDQESGRLVATRDGDGLYIPASTAKIVTAAGALGVLGSRHRFRTSVYATGELRDGVLYGDLYLKGTGDPLLSVQDLLGMVERLKDLGLGLVKGGFYYDETALPKITIIEPDQPASAPYNAGLSALSLDFNRIRAHWRSERDQVTAYLSPAIGSGDVVATDTDPGPGRAFVPNPTGGAESWALAQQHLPKPSGVIELPLRDPGRRTASVFRAMAVATGTHLPDPLPGTVPVEAREMVFVDSLPLFRTVRLALAYSNNVVTELIGLAAARKLSGKPKSLADSSRTLTTWLAARTNDLDEQGLELPNHSGLSAAARVSPKQMLNFIRHALLKRYGSDGIVPMLPAGGWRDSFGGRFHQPATAGWVWGKTGTMHYATGIVGVVFGHKSGRRYVFALYVMDGERRAAFDADPAREGKPAQDAAEDWIERAKALEEDIVNRWAGRY